MERCFDLLMQVPLTMYGNQLFCEICPKCERKAKPNKDISVNAEMHSFVEGEEPPENAYCEWCGPIRMPYLGHYPEMADALQ